MTDELIRFARREEWTKQAACIGIDQAVFFPERGASNSQAIAICRICSVTVACLDYALRNEERFGVWGGKSERDRRRLKFARSLVRVPLAPARSIGEP